MQPNDSSKKKRKQLTSQDLKRRLYEKGIHGNSMPSLKSPLTTTDNKPTVLYVNLNSSVNSKKQSANSPKILKKTASAFGSRSREQKGYFPNITAGEFMPKKKSSPFTNSPKVQSPSSPAYKTSINFFQSKRKDSQPKEQVPQFNSSFYKVDSLTRNNETRMTKRLVQKMSGHKNRYEKQGGKNRFIEDQLYRQNSPLKQQQQKDEILQNDDNNTMRQRQQQALNIGNKTPPKPSHLQQYKQHHQSSLEEYISLILKNVPNVDEFLYLVRHRSPQSQPQQQNIYQLEIIDYQQIKQKDKDPNFQYYTISKKGFCHYFGGKPIQFIDLKEWLEEKEIYQKIKKLKFFSRFRRWKTIKMWIKKVVRHRIEKCSLALEDRLFILNPTIRSCILQVNKINLEMEKSLCIISKNEGTYTLESFKHCQQKTRRESASIVEEFSRRSRQSVRRCFDQNLQNLKQLLKTRANFQDKNFAASTHNPKDNAFQVLGFPAKMSYEHRSKLRKLTGRFVRFSYLIDFIHLNGLAGIFKTQIQSFSSKLNKLQIQSQAQVICSKQKSKLILEQNDRQRMFSIQMIFKPYEISQAYINEIPLENFDISMKIEKASQLFNPLYHIREKAPQIKQDTTQNQQKMHLIIKPQQQIKQQQYRKYIPSICDLWLSMKPTLDNIFDQLSFLIKQSMSSLKYFQRWSKHRQMQKYINILQQWDDIVSENWQVCENDNLDPISIIQNLQSSMSRIKQMLQISQNKLQQKIVDNTTQALNIYWENTQADIDQLLTNTNIQNNAETIEYYLAYMSQWIEKFQSTLPNIIQLGIFTINLDKMKYQVIEFMKQACENFKNKLPQYVEDNTNELNLWLSEKAQLLRQQIHNIDDFVKLNKNIKIIDDDFHHKKQLCNDLGHIYQTMYNYKIESKKRKQFQSITLKAKDQLEQLLIHVEQNIQRKTEFFTRQVSRYHLPNLLKQIEKISDNISSEQFQSLKSSSENVIKKLIDIKTQYDSLKQKKAKCLQYLAVLKLSEVDVTQLDQLQRQINARLQMWQNMDIFSEFMKKIDSQIVSQMDLQAQKEFVTQKRQIVKSIQSVHNKPQNQVLRLLKSKVQKYFINLPLLQGFNDRLSDSHWDEIDEIVKEYPYLDLKKKQFTLKEFLETGIGKQAKRIEYIFNKAKVENQLQVMYSQVQNVWTNTLVKSKTQSKFVIISNPEVMRQAFDYMIRTLCTILSNPFSQTLRQYSLTYDTLIQHYNTFQHWISTQQHLLKVDSMVKLFDVKKLPDYNQFENSEKIYKNVMKLFIGNRSIENGIKMNKLFVVGVDDRLVEMDDGLKKVDDNIKCILQQHRKNYPPYYIFTDEQLFNIITTPSNHQTIQSTVLRLVPSLSKLEFQNQRIVGIYNIDNEKLQRNTVSTSLDVEQIIQQLSDTVVDNVRKAMRSCKYKAVQTSLIKLVPMFHCQYLLATNKIDFTNYTEISIENQSHTPQSLKQFYKVMKKDIIEDLRLRNTIKEQFINRYDTLLLQSLYHEQVLGKLIKSNIKQTTDYEWQRLLRFYWDQTSSSSSNSSNDDNNITVRQCHARIKYGNEYIGSRTKVVIDCDSKLLYALAQQETALVKQSSVYQLERVMNFIGQRVTVFECDQFVKPIEVTNYLISCWYWQTASIFKNFDLLAQKAKEQLLTKNTFYGMKQTLLKKNLFNIKQSDKKPPAIFLSPSNENVVHELRSQYRVVTHSIMPHSHIKNLLRVKDIFEQQNEISMFLIKLFEILEYLQQKSFLYNLSIEDFLENRLKLTTSSSRGINKHAIFNEFLEYIKPKIGSDTMAIMKQTVRLEVVDVAMAMEQQGANANVSAISNVGRDKQRSTLTAPSNKRSSSRASQQQLYQQRNSILINTNKLPSQNQSKNLSRQSITSTNTLTKPNPRQPRLSKLPIIQLPSLEDIKKKQLKQALQYRKMIILTGKGVSKMHLLKNTYKNTHKIIQVFSELQSQQIMKQEGIIAHYIKKLSSINYSNNENSILEQQPKENSNTILYFNTLTTEILTQMENICHNIKYNGLNQLLKEKNVMIVVGVEKLPQSIDYGLVSWLYVVNVELDPGYLLQVGKQWMEKHLQTGKTKGQEKTIQQKTSQQKAVQFQPTKSQPIQHTNPSPPNQPIPPTPPSQHEQFMKFYQQTLLATFDNWSIKDIKLRQRYIYMFLTYLQSLLPVKKLLQAMVYCFIRLFSNMDADYIKLEFLVKKLIGQDKVSEDERVYELVYYKCDNRQKDCDDDAMKNDQKQQRQNLQQQQQYKAIPSNFQGLVNSKQYYQSYCYQLAQNNHNTIYNNNDYMTQAYLHDHIITHTGYHYNIIMNRILSNTKAGIFLTGPTNSGKTTMYELFKRVNFGNRSFLKLTMLDGTTRKNRFLEKILGNADVWGLKQLKAKVNYQRSVVMVDDVSLDCYSSSGIDYSMDKNIDASSNTNKEQLMTKINTRKLTLITQLLQYKLLQYPSIKTLTAFHKSMLTLSNIDFILAGTHHPQQFTFSTIPIELTLNQQELKTIFNTYLRQRLTYFQINDLAIADIVSTTFDICKKLSVKNVQFDGLQIVVTKCILGKFQLLKIKDVSGNVNKQVEKYWVYLLQEHLGMYDNINVNVFNQNNSNINISTKNGTVTQLLSQSQQPQKKKQKSIIYKQLKNLNLQEIKPHTLCYTFLHTRSSPQTLQSNEFSKKVQFVKDIKKIFNVINEKIEKYNDSENKRYGGMFEYIHFDQLVKKVVKLANNLISKDYLLLGRNGSGKESLVKLVAYLQGSNYKSVGEQSQQASQPNQQPISLKQTITNIFLNSNITTMSSFILTKHLQKEKDIQQLQEYYYCDFENEILNNKQLDKPQKVYIKEKEKQRQRERQREKQKQREVKMLNTSTNSRMAQKTFGNINTIGFSTTPEYYIPPRQKLSLEEVMRYKQAIRVVILCSDRQLVSNLPLKIKHQLMLDQLEEIPITSMQQYTVKFLQAQQTKCSPKISLLLAQIWNFAKDELELTLRDYDDSVRLFCSFIDTLTQEIHQELVKYGRVITLYDSLKKLTSSLQSQVQQLHEQIKILTQQISTESQQSQEKKTQKHSIQQEMHKKSTYLNKSQKIIQMFDLLIPYFKQKHSLIHKYVMDKEYFEQSLAVGACYFTFMSEMAMAERRKMLEKWYGNVERVPLLQSSQPIQSFLTMFNLYPQQFNTQPIDDLQDFYQNMAIVFNSVKPVFIKDTSHKGKHWLQNVCSFVCVSEKESNFIEVICQNLIKPSNILIEITSQQTMNNLSSSFIHSLLFLSDTTQTVNIKGVEYKVSPQAKFYVLLNENIELSEEQKREFTIVTFSESFELLQKQLEYAMMSNCHADVFYSQLEMKKKIRNLKLQRQALMLEIADNMYTAYEGVVGGDAVKSKNESEENSQGQEEEKMQAQYQGKMNKSDKSKQNADLKDKTKKTPLLLPLTPTPGQLQQFISQLTDKTLTRGQNLSNKLKEKQQLCKDIESKLSFTVKYTTEIKLFVQACIEVYEILQFMQQKGLQAHDFEYTYCQVTHIQFVKRITMGIKRKFIKAQKVRTVLLFAIKLWGDQYVDEDFYVFLMAIMGSNRKLEGKLEFKLSEEKSRRNLYEQQQQSTIKKITTTRTILQQQKQQQQQYNNLQSTQKTIKQPSPFITLTPQLLQTIKSSSSYQQLKQQINELFVEYLSTSFTHDLLTPYYQNKGTILNLLSNNSSSDDLSGDNSNMMRYVVLNNIWVRSNDVNKKKKIKGNALMANNNNNNNNTSSLSPLQSTQPPQSPPQPAHYPPPQNFIQQKLQQNMKIVKLQIKSLQNLQHEIKRYIFQQNILMISTIDLLQTTLEHLYKLGSHEKVIYFNLQIQQFYINKMKRLVKKYQIREVNNIYEKRNKLLEESLFRLERERESKKLSSVRDIINSDRSISVAMGDQEDYQGIRGTTGGMYKQQQYYDYENNNINNEKRPSTLSKSNTNSKGQQQKLSQQQQQQQLVTKQTTQQQSQKKKHTTIIRSEKNLLQIQKQHQRQNLSQLITLIYNILQQQYLTLNLYPLHMSQQQQQIDYLTEYLSTCVYSEEQQVQFTLREKVLLVIKVIQQFVKEDVFVVDECIERKLGEIKNLVEETLAEKGDTGMIKPKGSSNNSNQYNNNTNKQSQQQQYQLLQQALKQFTQNSNIDKQITTQHSLLTKTYKKATKLQFQSQYVGYFMKYFSLYNNSSNNKDQKPLDSRKEQQLTTTSKMPTNIMTSSSMTIQSLVTKARNIFETIRNIDQPIAVKRNSRKSVNAIFRKEQLREKLLSSQQSLNLNANMSMSINMNQQSSSIPQSTTTTTLQKKPAINMLKQRGSKQSFLSSPTYQQQQLQQQNQQQNILSLLTQQHHTNLAPIMLQIQYKKLSSKINYLIKKIQFAIKNVYNEIQAIGLLLLLLQDAIPGQWLMVLGQRQFVSMTNTNSSSSSLQSLFKKYIRLQEDMSYCLERIKRNSHSEVDFTFVRFPKDYLQLYFRKRFTEKLTIIGNSNNNQQLNIITTISTTISMSNNNSNQNNNSTIFILMNNPSNEQLDTNSDDHIKIASIQCSGWRFSPTQANVIDIVTAGDKPSSSEAKLSQSCCMIKKSINSIVSLNNLVPIDVYESKQSMKPFMKVYAVCKKVTNTNSNVMGNNLLMYLKESVQM